MAGGMNGHADDGQGDFGTGVRDGTGIALGYFAISMAFGLSCVRTGLTPLAATMISLTNLSSSGQFAGVQILGQLGSYAELALTVLLINLRYVLMSFSLSQQLAPGVGTVRRLVMGYGVTDEIYALAMRRPVVTASYYLGLMVLPVAGWVGGTLAGATLGQVLPASAQSAMGVLLYAMFIAIVVGPAKASRAVGAVVALAAGVSVALALLPLGLAPGWRLILVTLVAAGVGATFFPVDAGPPAEVEVP